MIAPWLAGGLAGWLAVLPVLGLLAASGPGRGLLCTAWPPVCLAGGGRSSLPAHMPGPCGSSMERRAQLCASSMPTSGTVHGYDDSIFSACLKGARPQDLSLHYSPSPLILCIVFSTNRCQHLATLTHAWQTHVGFLDRLVGQLIEFCAQGGSQAGRNQHPVRGWPCYARKLIGAQPRELIISG